MSDHNFKNPKKGHLTLIIGPMFAGKTTELLRLHRRQELAGRNCLLVKYLKDSRYDDHLISTHDLRKSNATTIKTDRLEEIRDRIFDEKIQVIAIDEAQFFPDLAQICEELMRVKKIVILAALNTRLDRMSFEQISLLQPNADEITLLKAVCECGEDAIFTYRQGFTQTKDKIDPQEPLVGYENDFDDFDDLARIDRWEGLVFGVLSRMLLYSISNNFEMINRGSFIVAII